MSAPRTIVRKATVKPFIFSSRREVLIVSMPGHDVEIADTREKASKIIERWNRADAKRLDAILVTVVEEVDPS